MRKPQCSYFRATFIFNFECFYTKHIEMESGGGRGNRLSKIGSTHKTPRKVVWGGSRKWDFSGEIWGGSRNLGGVAKLLWRILSKKSRKILLKNLVQNDFNCIFTCKIRVKLSNN